jgi:hypothetical protein
VALINWLLRGYDFPCHFSMRAWKIKAIFRALGQKVRYLTQN